MMARVRESEKGDAGIGGIRHSLTRPPAAHACTQTTHMCLSTGRSSVPNDRTTDITMTAV